MFLGSLIQMKEALFTESQFQDWLLFSIEINYELGRQSSYQGFQCSVVLDLRIRGPRLGNLITP